MGQLAKVMIELTESESTITYLSLSKDDPRRREPDISRAKTLLNWQPTSSRELGLKASVAYLRDFLSQSREFLVKFEGPTSPSRVVAILR